MRPVLTAFATSPDRGRGLARDFRVRWALEEVGQPYEVRLLTFAELKQPAHRTLNPFGQIPTWQDGRCALFESGAIVLHIAERHPVLMPDDKVGRVRTMAWMFAAVDTVEPPIWEWDLARMVEGGKPWHAERVPMLEHRIHTRLAELAAWLDQRDWLESEFSAGDLMMVAVLRRLHGSGLLDEHPSVAAFIARGEARPAFCRAFAAQKAVFDGKAANDDERAAT